ncbi:TetR/AcrR family transcriptional regulator, partial [Actinomyces sp. oral taxon 448]
MTSDSASRSKTREERDLRAELLRTSRELLDDDGPSALSMREAARRTGCTHQAPYHYFPNREAILAALVTEGFEELANRLSAAHDGLEARGLTATLETSANAYIEFALRNPGVFRIMFRPDMCDPENFPEVRRAGERARGELTRLAQMVQGGGSTPEVEALFWAGVHGLASLLLDGPLAAELKTLGE